MYRILVIVCVYMCIYLLVIVCVWVWVGVGGCGCVGVWVCECVSVCVYIHAGGTACVEHVAFAQPRVHLPGSKKNCKNMPMTFFFCNPVSTFQVCAC